MNGICYSCTVQYVNMKIYAALAQYVFMSSILLLSCFYSRKELADPHESIPSRSVCHRPPYGPVCQASQEQVKLVLDEDVDGVLGADGTGLKEGEATL